MYNTRQYQQQQQQQQHPQWHEEEQQQQWHEVQQPPAHNAFAQRQQQWAQHNAQQGYQQRPYSQQPNHYDQHQHGNSYYPAEQLYDHPQSYLPSANPPFHATAPLQSQQPRYRNDYAQQHGGQYQNDEWGQPSHSASYQNEGYGPGDGWRAGERNHHGGDYQQGEDGHQPSHRRPRKRGGQKHRRAGYNAEHQASGPESGSGNASASDSSRPVPFARRKKAPRATGAPPPPSEEYLESTLLPPSTITSINDTLPPLLILDLNNTLLCRKRGSTRGSKHPIVRPYLSPFLQYICGASRKTGKRRWETAVYSSAASHNVLSLLEAIRLVPLDRAHEHELRKKGQPWDAKPDEPLNLVWSREKMNLSAAEFTQNVETVKDLSQVWGALPQWDSKQSVLLDDEAMKAAQHPYSHIPIHPFVIDPASAASPPSSPRRQLSPPPPGHPAPPAQIYTARPTHLPPGHPFYNDTSLLSTIYVLEQLREQGNVAAWMRQVGLRGLELQEEEERVEAGRRICEGLGIEVRREWEEDWWSKCSKVRGGERSSSHLRF